MVTVFMMLTHLFDMGGVSRVLGPVARWEGRLSCRVDGND